MRNAGDVGIFSATRVCSLVGRRRHPWIEVTGREAGFGIVALGCLWLLTVILANPVGEFPLDDDWSYARAVQTLVQDGRLELTGFTSMPLVAQVIWGWLFSLPFGFSFTALRASSITLGLFGLIATHGILKEMRVDGWLRVLAVAVLAFNPVYFLLSMTFMTDVPFFTFSALSFWFLLRHLRTDRKLDLVAGYSLSLVAILVRQLGVIIPAAFLIAYVVRNGFSLRTFRDAVVPTGALASLLLVVPYVLKQTIGLPALYDRSFEPIAEALPAGMLQVPWIVVDRFVVESLYLGLFILPLMIPVWIILQRTIPSSLKRQLGTLGVGLFAVMAALLLWQGRAMPLIGNILVDMGVGPVLLRDTYLLRLPHWPVAPEWAWPAVTVAALAGSVLLVLRLSEAGAWLIKPSLVGWRTEKARRIFPLIAVALYSCAIVFTGFLDRYLIWPLPALMAVTLTGTLESRPRLPVFGLGTSLAIVLAYAILAVGGTHDNLSWNRARWQALTDLLHRDRVSYTEIDGGFEFNGWYGYDPGYPQDPDKSWWWVAGDTYMVSLGPVSGYLEMRRYSFDRWIPPGQGNVFVLRRIGEPANGDVAAR